MAVKAGQGETGHDTEGRDTPGRDRAGSHQPHPEIPDTQKLAQDWITLWQSELAATAADPEVREAWQAFSSLWAGSMASVMRGLQREQANTVYDRKTRDAGPADAPRAAPVAAAPDPRDVEIERLARHVAALEQRLAGIERIGGAAIHPKIRPGRKQRR